LRSSARNKLDTFEIIPMSSFRRSSVPNPVCSIRYTLAEPGQHPCRQLSASPCRSRPPERAALFYTCQPLVPLTSPVRTDKPVLAGGENTFMPFTSRHDDRRTGRSAVTRAHSLPTSHRPSCRMLSGAHHGRAGQRVCCASRHPVPASLLLPDRHGGNARFRPQYDFDVGSRTISGGNVPQLSQ